MTATFSLSAPREALLAAVDTTLRAVERRNTIPVLANLMFERSDDRNLRVSGTDLDVVSTVETAIPLAECPAEGVTLPAGLLSDILRKLPEKAEVKMASESGQMMKLTCGRSRFNLQTLPGEDWPRLEDTTSPDAELEVPATRFAAMLAAVSFAISTEETRYYLNGVYMHSIEDRLVTVATDGHRLARAVLPGPGNSAGPGVIIPRKTVDLVSRALAKAGADATIAIGVSANRISFEIGAQRIVSKLIDGTFPDYERVIPASNPNRWRFGVSALLEATERVSLVSSERGRAVKMTWGRESVSLEVQNPDTGQGEDSVEITCDEGDEVTIGFNAKYLADMLAHMDKAGEVRLADGGSPARFAPVHNEDDEIEMTFVLMPMRV
ncbi:DNA polymerase III subunit beta [Hoeflea sp.]|uniref:DNA polymerase III subunit beta n=1 Tax=Hoeflea sp. TaxID=1940281 RepID=UPI0037480774